MPGTKRRRKRRKLRSNRRSRRRYGGAAEERVEQYRSGEALRAKRARQAETKRLAAAAAAGGAGVVSVTGHDNVGIGGTYTHDGHGAAPNVSVDPDRRTVSWSFGRGKTKTASAAAPAWARGGVVIGNNVNVAPGQRKVISQRSADGTSEYSISVDGGKKTTAGAIAELQRQVSALWGEWEKRDHTAWAQAEEEVKTAAAAEAAGATVVHGGQFSQLRGWGGGLGADGGAGAAPAATGGE